MPLIPIALIIAATGGTIFAAGKSADEIGENTIKVLVVAGVLWVIVTKWK